MHIAAPSHIGMHKVDWALKINRQHLADYARPIVVVVSLTAAVAFSAISAYFYSSYWGKVTATVTLISLYAMPKVLRYGSYEAIHRVISIHLAVLNCLFLGGMTAALVSMSQTMMTSLKAYQFTTPLFCIFGITALLGYGMPLFEEGIEKAYHFLKGDSAWKEHIENLQKQFHRMPEMGLGLLQTNLWQSLILHLALIKPDFVLSFWRGLFISSPDYVWSIAAATSEKMSVDQFKTMLNLFEEMAIQAEIKCEDVPDEIRLNCYNRLKIAIKGLRKEDVSKAATLLLESGSKFVPRVLNNEQFLELFVDDVLQATNEWVEEFIDQAKHWPHMEKRHHDLKDALSTFKQELRQDKPSTLYAKLESMNQEFSSLRREIERTFTNKRTWQNFTSFWKMKQKLPFRGGEELLTILHDKELMDKIKEYYFSFIGTGQTLSHELQLITNKMLSGEDTGHVSVIILLAAKKGFVQHDFEDLQEWLKLDSPNDIEEALASIGLGSEEDLYLHQILEPKERYTKAKIKESLHKYIEAHIKQKKIIFESKPNGALFIGQKISKFLYQAIVSGLILVPIFIHPFAGASGFILGSSIFVLKRFGVQKAVDFVHFAHSIIEAIPLGGLMRNLIGRRVFSLTTQRREGASEFATSDFYGKMRSINLQMITTIFISYLCIKIEQPYLASFLQGIAFANEVVHLA